MRLQPLYELLSKTLSFPFLISFGLGPIALYALPEHIYVECIHAVVYSRQPVDLHLYSVLSPRLLQVHGRCSHGVSV